MIHELTYDALPKIIPLYTAAWSDSHKNLCSAEFLKKHDTAYMEQVLQKHIEKSWRIFSLTNQNKALGMVGAHQKSGELGLLYVMPSEQGRGIGTQLLRYGVAQLHSHPDLHLWVLSTNIHAARLYMREGFTPCGERLLLSAEKNIYEHKYRFRRN